MKSQGKNLCPICGGKKVQDKITYTVDKKSGLLVVRDVPAMTCSQCGEEWIDNTTAKQLEKMLKNMENKKCEFEVMSLH